MRHHKARKPASRNLRIETLDSRALPATVSFTNGILTYTAALGETNNVSVSGSGSSFTITDPGGSPFTIDSSAISYSSQSGSTLTFSGATVSAVKVAAEDNSDTVTVAGVSGTLYCTVFGGLGNDSLVGHSGVDYLYGAGPVATDPDAPPPDDSDTINGAAGNDVLWGDDGADSILGGDGV